MFTICPAYRGKTKVYQVTGDGGYNAHVLATLDRLEDAAIALRYLTGGNLTDEDLTKARAIFAERDATQGK